MEWALLELPELAETTKAVEGLSLDASKLSLEVLTRMILSCVVDADRTDTEAHLDHHKSSVRKRAVLNLQELDTRLDSRLAAFDKEATPLNRLRHEMYERAIQSVTRKPGFFRLTMPTGGGKTLTSLSFSLKHAVANGLGRVIYAIPYTSIIDQTAKVFRQNLNRPEEENVLEHHSAVEHKVEERDDSSLWRRLLSESWNSPVIVTTTVQLFESLFANKVGRIRKLHSIAGSVIVLDEVQALPTRLIGPIMDMLSELVARYRVSVVLCTATQPTFSTDSGFEFPEIESAVELVPEPEAFFKLLKRVEYDITVDHPTPWIDVADSMLNQESVLTIVNLRRHAQELYRLLSPRDPEAFHLSTNMYPIHRQAVLERVRRRLKDGLSCRVVSTQLIECGVDVDFPAVFRAVGPLDAMAQAAGRCNREGGLTDATGRPRLGRVWVFKPDEAVTPDGDYLVKVSVATEMLHDESDLHDPDIFAQYFKQVFQSADALNLPLQSDRERHRFAKVAHDFKFIDADTVPVVITRHADAFLEEPHGLLRILESTDSEPVPDLWQRLQMYSVGLYPNQISKLSGKLRRVLAHGKEELELYEWMGVYDDKLGLLEESDPNAYMG